VLAICCLSLFVVGMDVTIIDVALPSIGRDLRAPVSGLQWTLDAYLLVLASLLMLSGSVADRVGWRPARPARRGLRVRHPARLVDRGRDGRHRDGESRARGVTATRRSVAPGSVAA
jgi:MFS family permease